MFSILLTLASIAVTPANAPAAIKAAQPGDVLVLEGEFPTITLTKRVFAPRLIFDASKARVAGVVFNQTSGVDWQGGRVTQASSGYAFRVLQSSSISIRGAVATEAVRGIVVDRSTDIAVSGNTLTKLRTDGIDVAGSQRVVVAGNRCSDFAPIASDHPDCVQAWNVANTPITADLTIVGNSAEGAMQGIGLYDAPYERVAIIGNRIRIIYPQGVALYGATDSLIMGNDLASIAPLKADGKPSVKVNINMPNSVRVTACSNLVPDVKGHLAAAACN